MFQKYRLKDFNIGIFVFVLIAMSIGVVMIKSAKESVVNKQIFGVALSIGIMLVLTFIDYHFICKFYIILYGINLALLLSVLLFGINVNQATRWFSLFGVTFQPSELTKVILIVFFAKFLEQNKARDEINSFRCLVSFAILIVLPLLLIFKEPDLSTSICILAVVLVMLYLSGLSYKLIGIALLVLIPAAGLFIWYIQQPDQKLLYAHQINRIMSFLYPSKYGDISAQQVYSVMAIGSGQLNGKGINPTDVATVKDANLISEQQTDFIFSVIGEELGFIGSVIIIAILLGIVLQCIRVARRARDLSGMLIASAVGFMIGFQTFINVSVATQILPNTGIPLPFISYGLSSLLSTAIGIGMVLNVSLQRDKFL